MKTHRSTRWAYRSGVRRDPGCVDFHRLQIGPFIHHAPQTPKAEVNKPPRSG